MNEAEQRFQDWFEGMDIVLEEFFLDLPDEVSARLDYSIESLEVLEAWFLDKYAHIDELRADPDVRPWDGAARYYGEVLIKHVGGHWAYNPHNGGQHPPMLAGWPIEPYVPMFAVSASTDRRTGVYLRTIAEKNRDWDGKL